MHYVVVLQIKQVEIGERVVGRTVVAAGDKVKDREVIDLVNVALQAPDLRTALDKAGRLLQVEREGLAEEGTGVEVRNADR